MIYSRTRITGAEVNHRKTDVRKGATRHKGQNPAGNTAVMLESALTHYLYEVFLSDRKGEICGRLFVQPVKGPIFFVL